MRGYRSRLRCYAFLSPRADWRAYDGNTAQRGYRADNSVLTVVGI